MKKNFTTIMLGIALFGICNFSHAANYYFSSGSGDDSRSPAQAQNPSTPWKTIDKLNKIFSSLQPGDAVLFKRGETFYGSIYISKSGSSGSPIKIGAYGSGSKPVITSLVTLNNWASIGNGRYETSHPSLGNEVSTVLINGRGQEMGRYPNSDAPNKGYLTIDAHSGNSAIQDQDISSAPNFTGGEVVIRKNQWIIDRHPITSHSGSWVNYSGSGVYNPTDGYGYFIQGHVNTLDRRGEWAYRGSSKKMQVFFGSETPSSFKVQASTLDHLIHNAYNSSYITIESLNLKGSNKDALMLEGGNEVHIRNCDIEYAGTNGITTVSISKLLIEDSQVLNANNNGIYLRYGNEHSIVRNNRVENTFINPGSGVSGDGNGIGIFVNHSNDNLVEYNEVINTGYIGISFGGNATVIKNNFIDTFCVWKSDGGGIYTFNGKAGTNFTGRKILNNIIVNGYLTLEGTSYKSNTYKALVEGIFLDDNSTNVEIKGNTIGNINNNGIKIQNARHINVDNNTIFNANAQIMLNNSSTGNSIEDVTLSNNILFSKLTNQWTTAYVSNSIDITPTPILKGNYHARPLGDEFSISNRYRDNSGTQVNAFFNLEGLENLLARDLSSVTNTTRLKTYKINDISGSNKVPNGKFDKNADGSGCVTGCNHSWISGGSLDGGAFKAVTSSQPSAVKIDVGSISNNKNYILKFSAMANKDGALRVVLRQANGPWQEISTSTTHKISSKRGEYETLFSFPISESNSSIIISSQTKDLTYWLDNIELAEADVDLYKPDDQVLFEYNPSSQNKTISLDGSYLDAKNKSYSGSITLSPYSSIVLMKTSATSVEMTNTAPTVKILSPQSNTNFSSGDKIEINAEASDPDGSISKVEFYNGTTLLGSSSEEPYSFTWENVPSGTYSITAKAIDNKSSVTTSTAISALVRLAPIADSKPFVPIYLNTGSSSDSELNGNIFVGDNKYSTYYKSSNTFSDERASSNKVLQSERNGTTLNYSIPVPNGTYTVKTYHNELWFGKSGPSARAGRRVFDVYIEGSIVKDNFDIFEENANKPVELAFTNIEVKDGVLNIDMPASIDRASVSGIAITENIVSEEADTGGNSMFINTGSAETTSLNGTPFVGDGDLKSYYNQSKEHTNKTSSSETLFQSERYAKHLKYAIPLENGTYTIQTLHNELWFGNYGPSAAKGRRVFDISIEGKLVKDNFDLYEYGNKPTILSFENVEVKDGVLNLNMPASANNASLSGIAIINGSSKTSISTANLRMASNIESPQEEKPTVSIQGATKLFPNPASQSTTLFINQETELNTILIHNMSGQLIADFDPLLLKDGDGNYIIPLTNLKEGVYLINLVGKREMIEQLRLIVKP